MAIIVICPAPHGVPRGCSVDRCIGIETLFHTASHGTGTCVVATRYLAAIRAARVPLFIGHGAARRVTLYQALRLGIVTGSHHALFAGGGLDARIAAQLFFGLGSRHQTAIVTAWFGIVCPAHRGRGGRARGRR